MGYSTEKGQVIEIARGDLIARLKAKPLARGELFLHILKNTTTGLNPKDIRDQEILDIVTGTKITTLFNGDLFAGANSSKKVYSLGSGNSLKWGGILFTAKTYAAAVTACKEYPNTLYLYNGNQKLYDGPANANESELNKKYVAEDSVEYAQEINPGDLIFYSPVMDQIVVIHLNHTSDALTKIAVDKLVSTSMQNLLADTNGTLKDYLDGPARHYQYLTSKNGWEPVSVSTACVVNKDKTTGKITVTAGVVTVSADDFDNLDGDGVIHYIPFDKDNPGLMQYKVDARFNGIPETTILYEGDLILSIPAEDGGVTHKVISLYSELLKQLRFENGFDRADQYATDIWAEAGANEYPGSMGDKEWFATKNKIQDFIQRLFETKVDIDPVTGKIISSQLPDFLLGTPKYQGTFGATKAKWNNLATNTDAETFAKQILVKGDWENLDASEDNTAGDVDNVADSKKVNDALKTGSYWIYQGDTQDISSFTEIFNLASDPDDYDVKNTTDTDSDGVPDVLATHLLNKGDWIIYNGETKLFEIIDNTSSFIGLLVSGVKVAGVVKFLNPVRDSESITQRWVDGTQTSVVAQGEETNLKATADSVTFTNPATVLFKTLDGDTLTNATYLPVITNKGYAYSSRLGLQNNQTALNILFGTDGVDTGVEGVTFKFQDLTKVSTKAKYTFKDTFFNTDPGESVNTGTFFESGTDYVSGFDFWKFHWEPNWSTDTGVTEHLYLYSLKKEDNPVLSLPQYSGVLTTESYVNNGFTVIKAAINDAYESALKASTQGHVEWLQTVRETNETGPDGKPRKEIYDSKLRETYKAGESLLVDLFFDGDFTTYTEVTGDRFSRLGIYADITGKYDQTTDYELGATDDNVVEVLNPSKRSTNDKIENVLPNHSGVLLNNNSVIDCGEWY